MNERRRILDGSSGNVVTLRVTTTDGSTNVGIELVVTNGNNVYPVTTDSQGKVEMTGLSGGCTIDCETYEISVHEFIATGTMTVDISAYVNSFPVGETRSFNYTGAVSEVQLIPGSYKLQVWGAQGGSNASASSYSISAQSGGKGGYSEGILTLPSATTVKVCVGGQGSSSSGGFNGGGSTTGSSTYSSANEWGTSRMGGGGGASDIRLSDGALLSRMIVAGGGAGGAMCFQSKTTTSQVKVVDKTSSSKTDLGSGYSTAIADFSVTAGRTYYVTVSNYSGWYSIKCCKNSNSPFATVPDCQYWDNVTTFTPSSGFPYLNVLVYTSNWTSSTSVQIYHYETQSSTTTSNESQVGGVGGGTQGGAYSSSYAGKQNAAGSSGSFGQGAAQSVTNYRYCSGAGGGGWYGGGSAYSDSSMTYCKYSGGGSGFVNTADAAGNRPSGYTGIELDSGATYAGNTYFPNATNTGTEYGHSGNGYAKITRLDPATIEPLTFDILEDGTIGWKNTGGSYTRTIEYSKNGGAWTSITSTTSGVTFAVSEGDVVRFRGNNAYYSQGASHYNCFTSTCRFNVRGNVMSLIDVASTSLSSSYALGHLFYNNTRLVDASGMMLPATTLSSYCYQYMFYGCTGMTKAPEVLPAMTLQSYCYYYMFYNCTSLTESPELPAQALTSYCYNYMFTNCSSLNHVKADFATTPSTSYTSNWLSGVAATGTFVEGSTATWTTTGVSAVPTGWTVEYDHDASGVLTIESLEDNNEIRWYVMSGASSKAVYVAKGNVAPVSKSSSTSGTVLATLNAGEKLYIWGVNSQYASSTSYYCYFGSSADYKVYGNIMSLMSSSFKTLTTFSYSYAFTYLFKNNVHLIDASGLVLPVVSLTSYCYAYMFYGCTSLEKAPVLPATSLKGYCYNYMFYNCSSLNYIKAMFTTTPGTSYTNSWVYGVAASGTFVKSTSATWTTTGTSGIPSGWTVETSST